jgi:methylmalonyl-CoA/ethylmalonyl-CoA epimerase
MIIDHVGIVVRSIERSIERWQSVFGYVQVTEPVVNTRQSARVVFLAKPGSIQVKLIEPTGPSSPVHALARRGGGLHHLCFRCESIDEELPRLRSLGVRVLAPPAPGEAFEDETIAFAYAGEGLTIELIDTERRAGRLSREPRPESGAMDRPADAGAS